MAITSLTVYGGNVPNRAGDTPIAFADNVYAYQLWINNSFVPNMNTSIGSMNTLVDDVTILSNNIFNQAVDGGYSQAYINANFIDISTGQSVGGLKNFTTALKVTGTTKAAGNFYAGGTSPTLTTRTNYDGYFHATQLYDAGSRVVTTASVAQTVAGVKTFSSFPVTPSSAPTTDYQIANKKYVDDASPAIQLASQLTPGFSVAFEAGYGVSASATFSLSYQLNSSGKIHSVKLDLLVSNATLIANAWNFLVINIPECAGSKVIGVVTCSVNTGSTTMIAPVYNAGLTSIRIGVRDSVACTNRQVTINAAIDMA